MKWKRYAAGVMFLSVVLVMTGCGTTKEPAVTSSTPTTADTATSPTAISPQGERPSMQAIDYAAAAAKLGITEQQLRDALGADTQQSLDIAAAANKLGITEEALREALGFQWGAQSPGGERPSMPAIDYAAAAAKMGITEQQLRDALGADTQQSLDIAAAANKLGITEEALREALGFQGGNFPGGIPPTRVTPTANP
ncbi:MAG: hypothetical protein PHY28_04580 [Dehalococcoidales bacterium]|nr:hypothetical protein [Dehalococcoidales bacterium]